LYFNNNYLGKTISSRNSDESHLSFLGGLLCVNINNKTNQKNDRPSDSRRRIVHYALVGVHVFEAALLHINTTITSINTKK